MPNPDPTAEQWTVTGGSAEKNVFIGNQAPIVNDNQGTVNIQITEHQIQGDQVGGDKVLGDKVLGDKITQTIHIPQADRPIPSNIRTGSKNFVEHGDLLGQLERALATHAGVLVCSVEGMGGVGKTELALQYAQQHQADYAAQYWLSIRDKGLAAAVVDFASSYLALPEPLQGQSLEAQAQWYWQNWLPAQGNLLVILDDVPNAASLSDRAMPRQERVKVILTTRERALDSRFVAVSVAEMPLDRAVELLEKIVGAAKVAKERATVAAICKTVGQLPLAVELMGEYLAKNRHLTFSQVQDKLALADQVLSQTRRHRDYGHRGVAAALQLTWTDLSQPSRHVAMLLGLFDRASIAWALVEQIAEATDLTPADLETARGELDRLHLIRPLDEACTTYTLHALVQAFCQDQLSQDPDRHHPYRQALIERLLAIAQQIPQTTTLDLIQTVAPAIPHLERLSQEFLDDLANPEDDLIWAFEGIARFYAGQGLYALAAVPRQRCMEIVPQRLGADHPHTATSLNNLAGLYRAMGRYGEAEPRYARSLAIREQQLGADHPHTATSLNNLAGLYRAMGRYGEAEPRYARSLAIREQQLGADHPDTAASLNNLALLYKSMGRYGEAEPLYARSLAIREQQLGADHPDTAASLNNLAGLYDSMGRYGEAEPLYARSLAICEQQLEADHPDTAAALNNLAGLYSSMGRYGEAEPLYARSLAIREQQLGADHPATAASLNNLAELYRLMGRYGEAEPLYARSLEIWEQQLGADHPDTATSLNNLAGLYDSMGRYGEAEPLYARSLAIREQQLGADHPATATALNNLAGLYDSMGRYGEAEPLYARSLAIREQQLGADHPDTAASLNNLAGLYSSMGRYGEAEPLYARSLAIREQQLGADHPATAASLNNLARLYDSMGRYCEAEPLYARCLGIFFQALGQDHPNTQAGLNNFVTCLQAAVAAGQAGALSSHPLTQAILAQLATDKL